MFEIVVFDGEDRDRPFLLSQSATSRSEPGESSDKPDTLILRGENECFEYSEFFVESLLEIEMGVSISQHNIFLNIVMPFSPARISEYHSIILSPFSHAYHIVTPQDIGLNACRYI